MRKKLERAMFRFVPSRMTPRVPVWDCFDDGAPVALAADPTQPVDVAVDGCPVFQVAPNGAADCRFQPPTHFDVHFQSDSGADGRQKLREWRATMHRCAVANAPGAAPKLILMMYESTQAMSGVCPMRAQVPLGGPPWLSVSSASWCSPTADRSFGFARMAIHAGFSPMACRGLCSNCLAYSGEPSDESRWATKLAAPAAGHSELAVADAEQVTVALRVAAMAVALASPPCLDVVNLMKADVWMMSMMPPRELVLAVVPDRPSPGMTVRIPRSAGVVGLHLEAPVASAVGHMGLVGGL